MSDTKLVAAIVVMAAVTFMTRALPFIIFGKGNSPAPIILFLGKYLPPALISAIIVYCYRNVHFLSADSLYGLPEVLAAVCVVLLQLKFKNTMVSIFTGTVFYMIMLRLI